MKLSDMTISTRLSLGFGIILAMVIFLVTISINQANRLWKNTDELYNHPYQVGSKVRDIMIEVNEIHRKMKDLAMDESLTQANIEQIIFFVDSVEKKIYDNFKVVSELYLGPETDIKNSYQAFVAWKPIRDSLIFKRLNMGRDAAFGYYLHTDRYFARKMISVIQSLIEFSTKKGDSFYTQAELDKNTLYFRMLLINLIIFIATIFITYILIRGIRNPLKDLTEVTNNYSKGNYNTRSDYVSANEIGILASTFNNMAVTVQNDITIKENAAWISKLMMNENELRPFCRGLLNALLEKTESQVAAIYFLNRGNGLFEHYESIGLSAENLRSFSASLSEGEFGAIHASKRIQRIKNIPEDTVFVFPAVTGTMRPKEIITIPVVDGNEVIAIISLACIRCYSELSVRLLEDIMLTLTARILGVLSFQKVSDFSSVLDIQNKELQQKSKELVMQTDELKEYNIELELQKKQLDEANRLKSSFLSNMSHELRTPLNSVIALSGVLSRRLSGKITEDEYHYLEIIEKSGKILLSLINDILDLSRIEAGKEEVTVTQFSMSDLVNDIVSSLEPVASEKGVSISSCVPPDLPLLASDREKCHHIMQNIISNAVKFTERGSVEITALVENENLSVKVKDSGIGIPEDFIPFVFDEFRQADDKASRKYGGTGLGLAIVNKYCLMLNGSIDVISKQGAGSTFTVILPLTLAGFYESYHSADIDLIHRVHSSGHEEKGQTGSGKTILLVEDSEAQVIQLTDILEQEGFTIRVASNGREALASVQEIVPDAMILDLQMPEVDGFEVLKRIRDLEETKSIPVLILTSKHITKSELGFLKENHIYQLIQKGSLNRNDLLACVKNLIIPKESSVSSGSARVKRTKKSNSKSKILIVEDNADNLITLKAILDDNYLLAFASDGYEGLEKAMQEKPNLILLDISLPGLDGFKVLDEIRKNNSLSRIPVVALTARAMKGDREDLLAYGFDGYIAKPIDSETFERIINEFLGTHQ